MTPQAQVETTEIAASLLKNPDFIMGMAKALKEHLATDGVEIQAAPMIPLAPDDDLALEVQDFQMTNSIEDLLKAREDHRAGRTKSYPWREVKAELDAIHG